MFPKQNLRTLGRPARGARLLAISTSSAFGRSFFSEACPCPPHGKKTLSGT